jgi:hypothetical protein
VYLSCPRAPRANIVIDGRASGVHHGEFVEVSCALHTVAFTADDGRTSTKSTTVSAANTRTSPAEVRCALD